MKIVCLAFTLASLLGAQPPQFEVATIRLTAAAPGTEGSGRESVEVTSANVTIRNASLSFLIQWAYDVQFYQVSAPAWLKDQRYDSFKLVLHSEQQSRPIYSLVTRNSSNLKPASAADSRSFGVTGGDFVFRATTMVEFADQLSDFATVDRPVIDKTGLTGRFNFMLDAAARAIRSGDGPSIFTAVSELGLQMRPENQLVDVLIVDSAARNPSEN